MCSYKRYPFHRVATSAICSHMEKNLHLPETQDRVFRFRCHAELIERLEVWALTQPDHPCLSEAVRRLCEEGMKRAA